MNEGAHAEGEEEQEGKAAEGVSGEGGAVVEVVFAGEFGDADGEGLDVVVGEGDEGPDIVVVDAERGGNGDGGEDGLGERQGDVTVDLELAGSIQAGGFEPFLLLI